MPIFEYVCKTCGEEFEKLLPAVDAKTNCPKCGSKEVGKKLSRFAASVKNSGCPSKDICPGASSGGCGCGHAGCCHH